METITLGQISVALALIVSVLTGIGYLHGSLSKLIKTVLKENFDGIEKKIDDISDRLDDVDMATCKNYLVGFLADVDQDQPIDEVEKERFWEQYEHYEKLGGNSYIHRKVETLKAEGKL